MLIISLIESREINIFLTLLILLMPDSTSGARKQVSKSWWFLMLETVSPCFWFSQRYSRSCFCEVCPHVSYAIGYSWLLRKYSWRSTMFLTQVLIFADRSDDNDIYLWRQIYPKMRYLCREDTVKVVLRWRYVSLPVFLIPDGISTECCTVPDVMRSSWRLAAVLIFLSPLLSHPLCRYYGNISVSLAP